MRDSGRRTNEPRREEMRMRGRTREEEPSNRVSDIVIRGKQFTCAEPKRF